MIAFNIYTRALPLTIALGIAVAITIVCMFLG